jgi:hypothetical protein
MKRHLSWAWLLPALVLAGACRKNAGPPSPATPRTVNYVLYTEKDFSTVHDTIRFEIIMKTGSTTLLDSPLAPMTVAQVPGPNAKISITKTVPDAYRDSDLLVGFLYSIDNVGMSWYLDSSKAGNPQKMVTYKFE